jgi:hypothetical protein
MGCDRKEVPGQVPRWCVLAVVAALLLACGPNVEDGVPTELQGRWITSEPKYDGRYLEIQSGHLIWGLAEWELYNHPIEKVESRPDVAKQIRYWLHYTETAGYPNALEILLRRGTRVEIRFANRPEVWTRAPPR